MSPGARHRSADPADTLFGVRVDPLTRVQVLGRAQWAVDHRTPLRIGVVNAAKIVRLTRDPALRDAVLACDLVLADGQSIVWASRLLRRPLPERVAGIDLFETLLELADRRQLRVYLLGATDEVLAAAEAEIARRWPGAAVCGRHDGYLGPGDEPRIVAEITRSHADLLFVGMTTPLKELFLARWGRALGVPVQHGVGGAFDVLAGRTRRAPRVWQRAGLEWAYRAWQEPRRLGPRYVTTNLAFLGLLGRELLRPRPPYPSPHPKDHAWTSTPGPRSTVV